MIRPQVHLVASTTDHIDSISSSLDLREWKERFGTEGEDFEAGSPEVLTEFAGKLCYQSFSTAGNSNLTRANTRDNTDYIQQSIIAQKHGSVLEHSSVTLLFEDVSRVVTHELVRHRAGTAFSQESGRYVRVLSPDIYMPQCIKDAGVKAMAIFLESAAHSYESIKALEQLLDIDNQPFEKKKEITSALRRLAPTGSPTYILVTANFRAWRWIIDQRTSPGAEEEIRMALYDAYLILRKEAPALFADAKLSGKDGKAITFTH